jgi:uncharacterized DUF497 family protein
LAWDPEKAAGNRHKHGDEIAKMLAASTDELLGMKREARSTAGVKNRRLSRRLQTIDALPKRDQEALLRTIDAFISKTG